MLKDISWDILQNNILGTHQTRKIIEALETLKPSRMVVLDVSWPYTSRLNEPYQSIYKKKYEHFWLTF